MRYTRVRVLQLGHHDIIMMIQLVSMTLCSLAIIFTQKPFCQAYRQG